MAYIGKTPTKAPLTSSDIANDIINADKIANDSISEEHIDNTAITGHSAITSLADTDKFLVSDASDSGNLKYVESQYIGGGLDNWSESSGHLLPSNASYGVYLGVNSATAANLLDDYEEGTWTPSFANGQGLDSISHATQEGNYVKIGRLVMIRFRIKTSSASGNSNQVQITGLPFTPNASQPNGAAYIGFMDSDVTNSETLNLHLYIANGSNAIYMYKGNSNAFTGNNFSNPSSINLQMVGQYEV